jgi:CheY-like chemotaxis protein
LASPNIFPALPDFPAEFLAWQAPSEIAAGCDTALWEKLTGSNPGFRGAQHLALRSRTEENANTTTTSRPVSIVLVEDNPADVVLVREALEENGVLGELVVLSDGEKAIHFIQELEREANPCPDLFIIDLNLPRKPGREVLEHIRAGGKCKDTEVVILSSSDSQKDRDEATRLGASKYICKPSRLEQFLGLGATFRSMIG